MKPSASARRGSSSGRRTSLAQQISTADLNPEEAAKRRATLQARRATASAKEALETQPNETQPKPDAAAAAALGVDAARFAGLIATHEANEHLPTVEDVDEEDLQDVPLFMPEDMRCLALLAEEPLHETMREFIREQKSMLGCFRLVADDDVKALLAAEMGSIDVAFGPTISSPTQGGDQQVAAMLAMELLGGVIQLADPCTMGAHNADTASLHRLLNVHNVLFATNYTSASALLVALKDGLQQEPPILARSFFETLESPAVADYVKGQKALVNQLSVAAAKVASKPNEHAPMITPTPDTTSSMDTSRSETPNPVHSRTFAWQDKPSSVVLGVPVRRLSLAEQMAKSKAQKQQAASALGTPRALEDGASPPPGMRPADMRCLALISHNHMKPAMKAFVQANQAVLKRFRLTGTDSTMKMLKSMLGEGPDMLYGPTCTSGPLGGDAQVSAQIIMEDVGGVIFFTDPLSAHPHFSDIESLIRLVNLYSILHATNMTTAEALVHTLGHALDTAQPELMPSFFHTLSSTQPKPLLASDAAASTAPAAPQLERRPFKLFKRASTMRLSFKSDDDWAEPPSVLGGGVPTRRGSSNTPTAGSPAASMRKKASGMRLSDGLRDRATPMEAPPPQSAACAVM